MDEGKAMLTVVQGPQHGARGWTGSGSAPARTAQRTPGGTPRGAGWRGGRRGKHSHGYCTSPSACQSETKSLLQDSAAGQVWAGRISFILEAQASASGPQPVGAGLQVSCQPQGVLCTQGSHQETPQGTGVWGSLRGRAPHSTASLSSPHTAVSPDKRRCPTWGRPTSLY